MSAETEKVKNSFLRSISHDLRTPLTSIIGSSSTLLESGGTLPPQTQAKLAEGILQDSQWLLNMVENILSITRMQQNNMSLKKTEEIAEEVAAEAIATFHKRFPHAKITMIPPENVILVPIDAMLISQVLTNLLENTQRHARGRQSDVTLAITETNGFVAFSVTDTGPGIDADVLPQLYHAAVIPEAPYKDSSRGLGIGLSICRSIILAHGGHIYADNLPEGGACFRFTLPLEAQ